MAAPEKLTQAIETFRARWSTQEVGKLLLDFLENVLPEVLDAIHDDRRTKGAEGYLTEEQVCVLLHISRSAIQQFRLDETDPIPFLKAGRRNLYDPDEVRKWMRRHAERTRKPTTNGWRPRMGVRIGRVPPRHGRRE